MELAGFWGDSMPAYMALSGKWGAIMDGFQQSLSGLEPMLMLPLMIHNFKLCAHAQPQHTVYGLGGQFKV